MLHVEILELSNGANCEPLQALVPHLVRLDIQMGQIDHMLAHGEIIDAPRLDLVRLHVQVRQTAEIHRIGYFCKTLLFDPIVGQRKNRDAAQVLALAQRTGCILEKLVIVKVELFEVAQIACASEVGHARIENLVAGQVEHFEVLERVYLHVLAALRLEVIVPHRQIGQTD